MAISQSALTRPPRKAGEKSIRAASDSLGERVYYALKRDIVKGVHPPGEALTENLLAKLYKSSRTPVREAAVRLHQEHLLRIVRNRGYFVSHITLQQLNEIYEYRLAVECASAGLAASKTPNPEVFARLQHIAEMKYAVDDRPSYERFIEADTEFHVGIAKLSRNHLLVRAVEEARCQMERIMYAAIDIGYYGVPLRQHAAILKAIREHDPQQARKLMYEHISGSKDSVLQLASSGS